MAVSVLAGCGAEKTPAADGKEPAKKEESSKTEDKAPAADAGGVDISEHVDLTMYLVGDIPEQIDAVYAEVNKILEEECNATVNVEWLSWAEHDTKYSLLFSGGEDFDMIFTATTWCHFEQTTALGGFKALDEEFIKTYAPETWEMMPADAWKQATIDGAIHMVPSNFTEVTPDCVALRGDLVEKYGYEDITCYDDLVSFYKDCAADGIYATTRSGGMYWNWFQDRGYSVLSGAPSSGELILYSAVDPNAVDVRYVVEWDAFAEYCHSMKEMTKLGAWNADVLNSTDDRQDGLLTGRAAGMGWNVGTCAIYANEANAAHPEWKVNVYNTARDNTYVGTKYINGGMGINAASKNPERAMMVINELLTNPKLQDLTQLGIEGVNWKAVGDDKYEIIEGAEYTASNCWGWRNLDIMRKKHNPNATAVDLKQAEIEAHYLEHTRATHPLDSFAFDSTSVSTQYAAVEAAMGTYFIPLISGLVDDVDASLAEFKKAMDAAGVQDIVDEVNRQVEAYMAAQ